EARKPAELREVCNEALANQPQCFWARRHLATALLLEGKLGEAEAAFRKVLALAPDDALHSLTVAEIMLGTGKRRRGLALLAGAGESDPQFRKARLRLCQELAEQDKAAATWHARVLVELDSHDQAAREMLTKLAGEGAVKELEAATKKPEPPTAPAQ